MYAAGLSKHAANTYQRTYIRQTAVAMIAEESKSI
jgi:hypothetical protein